MVEVEWVSLTEATARLNAAGDALSISTLSRYIAQHAEAIETRVEGRNKLVHFATLAAHRAENVRLDPAAARAAGGAAGASPSRRAIRIGGTQSEGMARKVNADAELRELDLAERRGELVPTAEVDQAGRDAVALMMAAFDRAIETEAATLSVRQGWDERIARIALKGFARRGLETFNQEIRERLDALRRAEFDRGDGVPAPTTKGSLQ